MEEQKMNAIKIAMLTAAQEAERVLARDPDGAREALRQAVQCADALLAQNDPAQQRFLSSAYEQFGDRLYRLDDVEGARACYEAALAIDQTYGEERYLGMAHAKLGKFYIETGEPDAAHEHLQQALDIFNALAAQQPDDLPTLRQISIVQGYRGDLHFFHEAMDAALGCYEASLAIDLKLRALQPKSREAQRDLGTSHAKMGDVLFQLGDMPRTRTHFEAALQIDLQRYRQTPDDLEAARDLCISYENMADVCLATDQRDAAHRYYTRSLELNHELRARTRDPYFHLSREGVRYGLGQCGEPGA